MGLYNVSIPTLFLTPLIALMKLSGIASAVNNTCTHGVIRCTQSVIYFLLETLEIGLMIIRLGISLWVASQVGNTHAPLDFQCGPSVHNAYCTNVTMHTVHTVGIIGNGSNGILWDLFTHNANTRYVPFEIQIHAIIVSIFMLNVFFAHAYMYAYMYVHARNSYRHLVRARLGG